MPTRMKSSLKRLIAVAAGVAAAMPVLAAQRTFVASYGNDANVCSLVAPCRTFAAAITQTDPNGELIVLDSAGYGRVTIDKSLTITVPPGVYGGLSVFSATNGVDIATAGVDVVLRGVTINGQGGLHGVNFTSGAKLVLENCVIANMSGDGLHATASGASVYATDTVLRNNGNGLFAQGSMALSFDRVIAAQNVSNGLTIDQGVSLTLARSRIELNAQGLSVGGNLDFVTTTLTLSDTIVAGNVGNGVFAQASGNGAVVAFVTKARVTGNLSNGITCAMTDSATARCSVRDSTVSGNNTGLRANGSGTTLVASRNTVTRSSGPGLLQENFATFYSRTNNTVHDNGADTLGTITPLAPL